MSDLQKLTTTQREMIISLPYRVGLWISRSDKTGGGDADQQEAQVLSNIMDGFASDVFGSELVQTIMSETMRSKAQWGAWAGRVDSVTEDCRMAVDVLREYTDVKDVAAFRLRLIEIAEAVALAFSEYKHKSFGARISLRASYMVKKLKANLVGKPCRSLTEYLSISGHERRALGTLAEALGTTYI